MFLYTVLGILYFIFGITLALLCYFFYFKNLGKDKRCTKKTTGIVKRPSHIRYGDMPIPLVIYKVDNREYKVAGPRFKTSITTSVSTPFGNPITEVKSNLDTRDNLPDKLIIKTRGNSSIKITKSPLMELFPIGSEVDVYYNPRNPKESYVIRHLEPGRWIGLLLGSLSLIFFLLSMFNLLK